MLANGKPELLVPASSLDVLKVAVMYGADAVYIGGEMYGLRAKAKNFSNEDIKAGIEFAHKYGKRVFITANITAHNRDRSKNSYILSPRSVTLHPIGMPSLILKLATEFLAFVVTTFCPAMISSSATAASKTFEFSFASPIPMLITIFASFGTCITFL